MYYLFFMVSIYKSKLLIFFSHILKIILLQAAVAKLSSRFYVIYD